MTAHVRLRDDPLFPVALLAGPAIWLLLYVMLQPRLDWSWPLSHPGLFLWPVLFYPVVEEILFRGVLQELVREHLSSAKVGPVSVANIITSLLFTALHFFYQPPLWAALVLFPSLVFGHFKDRTGGLAAPIILHMFYNAGFLWIFTAP